MSSNSTRCAACKHLRRRCYEDCILAPYFPSTDPERFANVHRIFGASNLTKMLQQRPAHLRAAASDSLCYEAEARLQNPVYGCTEEISQLQQEIDAKRCELVRMQAQIGLYKAQQTRVGPPSTQLGHPFRSGLQPEDPPQSLFDLCPLPQPFNGGGTGGLSSSTEEEDGFYDSGNS